MLNIEDIIRAAAAAAVAAGDPPPIVAAAYEISEHLCQELTEQGVIGGYLMSRRPRGTEPKRFIAGWWIDSQHQAWFVRLRVSSTIILLGGVKDDDINAAMLLEARLKGVERIMMVDSAGGILREVNVAQELIWQLRNIAVTKPFGRLSFDDAYRETFEFCADRFRLPGNAFEPKRVLILIGGLGPGGAERQATYLASGLAGDYGYDVRVGCNHLEPPPASFFRPTLEQAGVRVSAVPLTSAEYDSDEFLPIRMKLVRYDNLQFINIFQMIFHFAMFIRATRPAIVHCWMDYCNVLGGLAAHMVGVPTVLLGCRSVSPYHFPALFQPYMRPGYKTLLGLRKETLLLFNSRSGAEDYAQWLDLPPQRTRLIHNGFRFPPPVQGARSAARLEMALPEDAIVVGTVTRFSEEKRPRLFVDMARVIHQRDPRVRFVAFGAGPLFDQIRTYVTESGLHDIVLLPGVTRDVWKSLMAFDVFVLTSRKEGLPNVLIEAQASSIPVVCTATGGMPETYVEGDTGLGIPSGSPEDLADAVLRIVGDPELRRRMSERAYRHARAEFAVNSMVQQTEMAYRDAQRINSAAEIGVLRSA